MKKMNQLFLVSLVLSFISGCGSGQKSFEIDSIDSFTYHFSPGFTSPDDGFNTSLKFDLKNSFASGQIENYSNTISCSISYTLSSAQEENLRNALSRITYSQISHHSIINDASQNWLQLNEDETIYNYSDLPYDHPSTLVMNSQSVCDLNDLINEIFISAVNTSECGNGINTLPKKC